MRVLNDAHRLYAMQATPSGGQVTDLDVSCCLATIFFETAVDACFHVCYSYARIQVTSTWGSLS